MSTKVNTHFGNSMVVVIVVVALVLIIKATVVGSLAGAPVDDGMSVAERVAPVGKVYTTDEKMPEVAAAPAPAAPAAAAAPKSGEEVYNSACVACHSTGVAGAPKFGDAAAWAPRIAKGIDGLMTSAINGLNAMPPRGTCGACSDDELKAAIEYMTANSQ